MKTIKKLFASIMLVHCISLYLKASDEEQLIRFIETVVDHKLKNAGVAEGGNQQKGGAAIETAYKALHQPPKRVIEFTDKEKILVQVLHHTIALAEEQKSLLASPVDLTDFIAQNKSTYVAQSKALFQAFGSGIAWHVDRVRNGNWLDPKNEIIVKIDKAPENPNYYNITINAHGASKPYDHELRQAHEKFATFLKEIPSQYNYHQAAEKRSAKPAIEGTIAGKDTAYGIDSAITIKCHKAVLQQTIQQYNSSKAKRNSLTDDEEEKKQDLDLDKIAKTFGQEAAPVKSAQDGQPKVEQKPAPKKGWF